MTATAFEIRRHQGSDQQGWVRCVTMRTDGLKPVLAFAHFVGGRRAADELRARFKRVHDDVLYERAV